MKFEVVVTQRAERELHAAADRIAKRAPETAARWFSGFVAALLSLEQSPRRYGRAREQKRFPCEVRQLLYGRRRSHRLHDSREQGRRPDHPAYGAERPQA